jgi:hypothetical protein
VSGHIAYLKDMGFTEEVAKKALTECVWDVNKALDLLLTRGASSVQSLLGEDPPLPSASVPKTGEGGGKGAGKGSSSAAPTPAAAEGGYAAVSVDAGLPAESVWRARPVVAAASAVSAKAPADGKGGADTTEDASRSTTASSASSPRSPDTLQKHGGGGKIATAVKAAEKSAAVKAATPSLASQEHESATVTPDSAHTPVSPTSAASPASESPDRKSPASPASRQEEKSPAPVEESQVHDFVEEAAEVVAAEEEVAATAVEQTTAVVEAVAVEEAAPVKAPKHIARAASAWAADAGQMTAEKGEFLRVWTDSKTEIGWIYAESLEKNPALPSGWLPSFIFENALPEHQRWMSALKPMAAVHASQLSVAVGDVLKIDVESRTQEGWAYAEAADTDQAGWVPVFCLDWDKEL